MLHTLSRYLEARRLAAGRRLYLSREGGQWVLVSTAADSLYAGGSVSRRGLRQQAGRFVSLSQVLGHLRNPAPAY